jgi:hypothetical protein
MISRPGRRDATRLLGGATVAAGAAVLIWPQSLIGRLTGGTRRRETVVAQILGGRQALQGTAQIVYPAVDLVLAGIAIDTAHAASMIILAALRPRYRRAAFASALTAGLSAAAGAAILVADTE